MPKIKPPRKKLTDGIRLKLTQEQKAALAPYGMKRNRLIRAAIDQWLAQQEKQKAA